MENCQENPQHLFRSITIPCKPDYSFLEGTYKKDEIIVSSEKEIEEISDFLEQHKITNVIKTKCNCDLPMQLWHAPGIDTIISRGKGPVAGTGRNTGTVGGEYSLNFLSNIPGHNWGELKKPSFESYSEINDPCDEILIAVLDTGVDLTIVDPKYISEGYNIKPGFECLELSGSQRNFILHTDDIHDDNPGRHGSLVTQFIINQFKDSKKKVKILPLKTHNEKGEGELFNIYCAVYYAMAKGAKIINASWGFYYYLNYAGSAIKQQLDFLISKLKEQGVLLVTAAGNETDKDDNIASEILTDEGIPYTDFDLRNLAIHQFFPACMSSYSKNVITVTTANAIEVAGKENYSSIFVDMGVEPDEPADPNLQFRVPFTLENGPPAYVPGSSFATAVATGTIGANCDDNFYAPNTIDKKEFISQLKELRLCERSPKLARGLIRRGVYKKGNPTN